MCGACEADEHLLLYCTDIHSAVPQGDTDLVQAFGFRDSDGKIYVGKAETTEHALSDWWQVEERRVCYAFFLIRRKVRAPD